MAERSFAQEVEKLRLGDGATFSGEGILAITKALLQCGVGYVGGYQGAPISHLMDVLADAQDILSELGVHFEASASEATATAMLAASKPGGPRRPMGASLPKPSASVGRPSQSLPSRPSPSASKDAISMPTGSTMIVGRSDPAGGSAGLGGASWASAGAASSRARQGRAARRIGRNLSGGRRRDHGNGGQMTPR